MTQSALTLFEGEVLPILEDRHGSFLAHARSVAFLKAQHGALVTVDDVRRECPPPEGTDPRVMGAIFRSKDWELVDRVNSGRRTCHKRPIARFRLRGA